MGIRGRTAGPLVLSLCFLTLYILFHDVLLLYYPSGDEISLIVNSCKSYNAEVRLWFTNGFYNYFLPYPEWMESSKTILRPGVNFIFFLNDILFKDSYGNYLLFTYLIHSLCCSFVFILCVKYLHLRIIYGIFASALMFINPAVINRDFFFHPGFSFDAFIAVFFFLCFALSINTSKRKNIYIVIPVLIAAFLTKEISLLLPLLVSATVYIKLKRKSFAYIAGIILTFAAYLIVRKILGFETLDDSSLGHFKSFREFFVLIVKGILVYPAGFYSMLDISSLINDFYFSGSVIIIVTLFFVIPVTVNLFLVLVFFLKRKFLEINSTGENFIIILLWTAGIYLYLVAMGLDLRFSYALYLFFIPLIFYLLKFNIRYKITAAVFLTFFLSSNAVKYYTVLNSYKEKNLATYECARQLAGVVKEIDNDYPILLVNDVSALFGSKSLNEFCNKKTELVKINSLVFYPAERIPPASDVIIEKDSVLKISVSAVSSNFIFEGVNNKFNHEPQKVFARNDSLSYFFPNEQLRKISSKGTNIYNFGDKFEAVMKIKTPVNVIYFRPQELSYYLRTYP